MGYYWQRWLAREFRAAGLKVVEVEGWENRGRPASTGAFDPGQGVVDHHTGTKSTATNPAPSLATLVNGRPDLPGPLCQYAVGYQGTVYVVAAGRANVNGKVGKHGVTGWPLGADGNALGMGNEVMTDGTQTLPAAQRDAIAVTNAVVLRHIGQPLTRIIRHEDISGTGKWDLGNRTTDQLRADAARVDLTPPEEDDMQLSDSVNVKGEAAGAVLGLDSISVDGALGYGAAGFVVAQAVQAIVSELAADQRGMALRIEELFAAQRGEVADLRAAVAALTPEA